jgi:ketosteroid isomerase-like protein
LPGGARYEGRQTIVENVLPLVPQFYDTSTFDLQAENVFTDGPTVIIEFSLRATCTNGRVNDGARYVWIFKVEDGKIVSAREYIDSLKLSRLFFP